ncbi:sugar transferase [Actinomycetes bacterium M1A6_2h]
MTLHQEKYVVRPLRFTSPSNQLGEAEIYDPGHETIGQTPPTIPFRPHIPDIPDPRRRKILHWVPTTISVLLEAFALIVALSLVPFGGNVVLLIASVVALTAVTQDRRQQLTLSLLDDLPRIVVCVTLVTAGSILVLDSHSTFGEAGVVVAAAVVAVALARNVFYVAFRRLRRQERYQRRTIVIGGGTVAAQLVASMTSFPEHGLSPKAMLDDSPTEAARSSTVPVEPLSNQLRGYIATHDIDTVVIAFSSVRESAMLSLLRECDRMDCELFVVPRLFEYVSLTGDMDRLHAIPLMRIRRDVHRSLAWRFKRVTSAVLAGFAIVAFLPVIAFVALGVWLSDRSAPVLFRQTRVSIDGSEFVCLKFRSMKPASAVEAETTWNISEDARLTRWSRFIRKTSLDELPQLWNVLVGDMHLVGPRPERPHFVEKFNEEIPGYAARHRIPGGLTGWAAVHGLRGDTSLQDRALYDNFYIENWSLWLDAKIIARTVLSIMKRTGG